MKSSTAEAIGLIVLAMALFFVAYGPVGFILLGGIMIFIIGINNYLYEKRHNKYR